MLFEISLRHLAILCTFSDSLLLELYEVKVTSTILKSASMILSFIYSLISNFLPSSLPWFWQGTSFQGRLQERWREFGEVMTSMIVLTDMAGHFSTLSNKKLMCLERIFFVIFLKTWKYRALTIAPHSSKNPFSFHCLLCLDLAMPLWKSWWN